MKNLTPKEEAAEVEAEIVTEKTPETKDKNNGVLIVVIVLVIIAICAFIYFNMKKQFENGNLTK